MQGGGSSRHRVAAASDVQYRHIHAAVWVDEVDEDLQKTYDRDIRVVTVDDDQRGSTVAVIDRKGHDGVTARDHGSTADIQRIPRARLNLVRVSVCDQSILPGGSRLVDEALHSGISIAAHNAWVFGQVHLIRTR